MKIEIYDHVDQKEVIDIWQKCGLVTDKNDPVADIIRKTTHSPDLFIVGKINGKIIATVMGGYEGRRGWINLLCVAPSSQRTGHGRMIMDHIENLLFKAGCPKINLQIRITNQQAIKFYESLGYSNDHVFSMAKYHK